MHAAVVLGIAAESSCCVCACVFWCGVGSGVVPSLLWSGISILLFNKRMDAGVVPVCLFVSASAVCFVFEKQPCAAGCASTVKVVQPVV